MTEIETETHVVHDVGPAFHGDALEHCQHGVADVVEADDTVLRTHPVLLAVGHVVALVTASCPSA